MRKRNGFTLVELLAVIVVLAIIMIIAIPAVLEVMNSARKSSFVLYAEKVITAVQTQFVYDNELGALSGAGLYVYDITSDLSLTSTGSNVGYVVVDNRNVDKVNYILYLHDNNYMVLQWDVNAWGMPKVENVSSYNSATASSQMATSKVACQDWANTTIVVNEDGTEGRSTKTGDDATDYECFNRQGYLILSGNGGNSGNNTTPDTPANPDTPATPDPNTGN